MGPGLNLSPVFAEKPVKEADRMSSQSSSSLGEISRKPVAAREPEVVSQHIVEFVSDSGEGRWTVQAAVELGVPASTITASLFDRFSSRGNADFSNKVISAMRKEFGGHHEKKD
jgi:6-phosphogluconate dehydrogenase (decarboxylating)